MGWLTAFPFHLTFISCFWQPVGLFRVETTKYCEWQSKTMFFILFPTLAVYKSIGRSHNYLGAGRKW